MTTKKKKHTYQSEILGLPPLKMILVHAENDRKNAAIAPLTPRKDKTDLEKEDAVRRIIEHLKKQ